MNNRTLTILIIFVLLVLAFGPWVFFWSVEALTGFAIPLTPKTWIACIVFLVAVNGSSGGSKS